VIRSLLLKKYPFGEADELVVFLSRDMGGVRGVAKNARKSRIRFGGHLEPFSLVDLVLRPRKKDDLVWIDDSQAIKGFLGLRSDLAKVALASYFFEIALRLQPAEQPDERLFDFLVAFLETLEASPFNPVRFMLDEIRLLAILGYGPSFDVCPECGIAIAKGETAVFAPSLGGVAHVGCAPASGGLPVLSPGTLALVRRGLQVTGDAAQRLRLSTKGIEELRAALSAFVRYLRGREVNSLAFIEKVEAWTRVKSAVRDR